MRDTDRVSGTRADVDRSRFAVALATFGTVCVLIAAAAILRPLAAGSSVGAAVVSFVLFVASAVAAERFGGPDESDVSGAVADVCAAGAVLFLASAAGSIADAAGASHRAVPVVAACVSLPYAVLAQRRRSGLWVVLATLVTAVVAVLGAIHLVSGVVSQAYSAGLLLIAVTFALAGDRGWLTPPAVVEASSALAALAAAAVLLGDNAGGGDVVLAVVLLVVVAALAATSRSPSLVAALAAASPVVVGLALSRTGYGWWSPPLAMAWTGAACALLAAYVQRLPSARHLGGVYAWCAGLVVIGDLFLANSTRLHALVAVVTSAALFVAAALRRRRPVAVLAGLTVLGALPRLVANAAASRLVLLAVGIGLLYLATTMGARRGRRTKDVA